MSVFNFGNNKLEYEFFPDVLEVTETPSSKMGKFIIYFIFILTIFLLFWSYISKVDVVISARGQILPNGNIRVVQSFKNGVLLELNVSDGDFVEEGDLLVKLDTDMEYVDKTYYESSIETLNFEKRILENLYNKNRSVLNEAYSDEFKYIVNYYSAIEDSYDVQLQIYNNQIQQNIENLKIEEANLKKIENNKELNENNVSTINGIIELNELNDGLALVNTQIEYAEEVYNKNKILYTNGVISEIEYLSSKSDLEKLEAEKKAIESNIKKELIQTNSESENMNIQEKNIENDISIQKKNIDLINLNIQNIEMTKSSILAEKETNYATRIAEIEKEITDNNSYLSKSNEGLKFSSIYSPISGTINGLSKNTIGQVVQSGETILTIVPDGEKLVAEFYLMNKDRGDVLIGQEVIIKVDAYPFQEFGTLRGEIENISSNSVFIENIGYVYKIKCNITSDVFEKKLESTNSITSGMEATGEIIVGQRRVIEYFFDPITKAMDESIKQK